MFRSLYYNKSWNLCLLNVGILNLERSLLYFHNFHWSIHGMIKKKILFSRHLTNKDIFCVIMKLYLVMKTKLEFRLLFCIINKIPSYGEHRVELHWHVTDEVEIWVWEPLNTMNFHNTSSLWKHLCWRTLCWYTENLFSVFDRFLILSCNS